MRARLAAVGLLLLVAGCASPAPPPPPPREPVQPSPPPPPPRSDLCRAGEHQHLIGRPRSEIPVPVNPAEQRVACTTCPMTMDHNPRRLNFLFDAATGTIREVKCG
jgi:hypothetical protein